MKKSPSNETLFEAWCNSGFQLAGHYDFRINTPVNWVITNCKKQYGLSITDSEIEELSKLKLIDFNEPKDREKKFPPFTPDRINFIKNVQAKFNLPISRLQQIIAYEDYSIRTIQTEGETCYKDTSDILTWYIKRTKFDLLIDESTLVGLENELKQGNESVQRQLIKIKGNIPIKKRTIDFLNNKKWEELPEHSKEKIKNWSFQMQCFDEMMRMEEITSYNNQILQGYSPQIWFSRYTFGKNNLNFKDINWKMTFQGIESYSYIDFLRTPKFLLEINDNVVDIKIIKPQEVDATTMRIIDKIYTIFRERIGKEKKAWGENSGKKIALQQRDNNLRKLYLQLRKEKPNVASHRLLDTLEEYTKKIGLPVSVERIKRIIYSSNNKTKTPANIST
jgi:hypothetical protein